MDAIGAIYAVASDDLSGAKGFPQRGVGDAQEASAAGGVKERGAEEPKGPPAPRDCVGRLEAVAQR